jgi:diguanylate cyclase (GGDEF)-like protein
MKLKPPSNPKILSLVNLSHLRRIARKIARSPPKDRAVAASCELPTDRYSASQSTSNRLVTPGQQVRRRVLTMFALSTLLPMLAFGYLVYSMAANQTLDQASARLKEESKQYALILLERLQTYAGKDANQVTLDDRPTLTIEPEEGLIVIGVTNKVQVADWLRDLDGSTSQRCLLINSEPYRCSGTLPQHVESLSQDWQIFLKGSFAPAFELSVRATTTKEQVLQSLSLLERLYPLLAVLISLSVCWIASRFLRGRLEPLGKLEAATTAIASGNYGTQVEIDRGDEFEPLASSLNEMSNTLNNSMRRLHRLADIDRMILSSTDLDEIIKCTLECAHVEGARCLELFLWRKRPSPIVSHYRYSDHDVVKAHLEVAAFAPAKNWDEVDIMRSVVQTHLNFDKSVEIPLVVGGHLSGFLVALDQEEQSIDRSFADLVDRLAVAATNVWRSDDLYRQASHDRLTGLLNRQAFEDQLIHALARSKRNQVPGALLFMDLDRFKQVNDTEGHKAGDRLLVLVARRLRKCLREEDTIARLGGDEFGVLIPHFIDHSELANICDRITRVLSKTVIVDRIEHAVSISIGVAVYPSDAETADELLTLADAAMYRAKDLPGGNASFYDQALNDAARTRVVVESRLRKAVKDQELELHFQPKMDLNTGAIHGAEGLMRWEDEELGSVSPTQFVPIAEDTGIIHEFLDVCLSEVHKVLRSILARGRMDFRIAINASPKQLSVGEFGVHFLDSCARHGLLPSNVELEFTESVFTDDLESVKRELSIIREKGVVIALDDFGTGYSSLNLLRELPIDVLKIDRSFITDVGTSKDALDLVRHVIEIAKVLGKEVVAEGVETGEQFTTLKKMGCQQGQGYVISPALPRLEFLDFLADHDRLRNTG